MKNATSDWRTVFWLENYTDNYFDVGDPFMIQIPVNYLGTGNNSVRIGTGFTPQNATGGSPDNKIIYSVRLKGYVEYGDVFNTSTIASEDAKSRLIAKVSEYVSIDPSKIDIESQSLQGIQWLWGPSIFKISMWDRR